MNQKLLILLVTFTVAHAAFTPSSLLAYLNSIAGKHTISGQFIEFGPLDPIVKIYNQTGKWLGLIGGDYWWYGEGDTQGSLSFNTYAIPYWQAGGLITVTTSMPNPSTGKGLTDVSFLNTKDLLTSGTATHNSLLAILGTVAKGFDQLQKAGVVVIWRPYHEMNGFWFWWGTSLLSESEIIALWQFTHGYMTNNMGLKNILWLWAGGNDLGRYPGSAYVDIVGQDLYTSDPTQGKSVYDSQLSLGKPVVLAEFGSQSADGKGGDTNFNETTLITSIQRTMPRAVFWQQWWDQNSGGAGWGMASVKDVSQALHNPWVLNREDLPK